MNRAALIFICCFLTGIQVVLGQVPTSEIVSWKINLSSSTSIPTDEWTTWEAQSILPAQDTFWLHGLIERYNTSQSAEILYLHNLQEVSVYQIDSFDQPLEPMFGGNIINYSQTVLPQGILLPGRGNSTQVPLQLRTGVNDIYLRVFQPISEKITHDPRIYSLNDWYAYTTRNRSRTYLIQGFIGGALLIIGIYHFLIYLIRRDEPFLWYSLYTVGLCASMLLETGILQSTIFLEHQWGYRILWETQLLSFVPTLLYFLFMRSFINLKKLIPWLDKLIIRFMMVYIPLSVGMDIYYVYTLQTTVLTYIPPLSVLTLGLFCVVVIFRNGDKLALYFTIGSLILYLCVFSNTMLSLLVSIEWISEPSFPRVWLTEIGVLLEILIFSLGLGYRLRLQDNEKRIVVENLRASISSDLHDDVGSMLSGLSMQAQVLAFTADVKDKESLMQISEISSKAMDTMRDTVWAIDSRKDLYDSLLDRMRDFAENTLFKSEISYDIQVQGLGKDESILPNIRQQLYLIYKEAISNILKHANATDVNVLLIKTKKTIELIIKDNGVGLKSTQHSGLGLSNMKMRAKKLNATIKIENSDGLKISVVVPL